MGKSSKTGKQRKDCFYFRAKEAGYRARSAFKLIQLNKKYNFLQSSQVCIDLCAAPGSWMQVATKFMPVSSFIIGVDLYPIHHIPNTLSIQGDITTEKVRQDLKSNLKTWKADLVLHDGAPNVGQNWLHDAYQQNLLVLHAFRLACEFLQKGGTFVTKVFRSKDHLSLQYVFRKLFKRVEATKPTASRLESAEMFVVCQGYLAPDKVDTEFFNPKFVFQTVEAEPKNTVNILKPEKKKAKAEGYEDGITMLYKKFKISDFIKSAKYVELLEKANEFEWDMQIARESIHTTNEIVEFCKDIKLISRKDLRTLINWRKAIRKEISEAKKEMKAEEDEKPDVEEPKDEEELELEEMENIRKQILEIKAKKDREEKQHSKKVEKKKKRLHEKLSLRLMVPGDPGPQEVSQSELFALKTLNNAENMNDVVDQYTGDVADSDSDDETSDEEGKQKYYSKAGNLLDSTGLYYKSEDSETEREEKDSDDDDGEEELNLNKLKIEEKKKKKVRFADQDSDDDDPNNDEKELNPLLTDLVGDQTLDRRERKAEKWFSKDIFGEIENDELEDFEIDSAIRKHSEAGGKVLQKNDSQTEVCEETKKRKRTSDDQDFDVQDAPDSDNSDSGVDSDDDSDSPSEADEPQTEDKQTSSEPKKKIKKGPKLDSFGLALATKMIKSKKTERDIYDDGWNRYMWGDEDLPEWFEEDEKKNNFPRIDVEKEDMDMYEDKNKPVDARTIKKVSEAKARKKQRLKKRMAKARKKAEAISNNAEMTEREKATEMNKLYKKAAAVTKNKGKKYIVMKKSFGGKRPKGVKGPSKMVDRRLKKDKRASEKLQKKKMKGRRK